MSETNELKEKILKVRDIEAENHIGMMYSKSSHLVRKRALLKLMLNNMSGRSFIDIGCAEGLYCYEALKLGASSVVGIDVSQQKIERAKKLYQDIDFRVIDSDAVSCCIRDKFDFVLCAETLQHILDYKKTLKEMISLLNEHGLLLITVPNLSKTIDHIFAKIDNSMSVEELLREIGGAGHGKQNAIWKFNTDTLEKELKEEFVLNVVDKVMIDTPDGAVKNLWTIFLLRKENQ